MLQCGALDRPRLDGGNVVGDRPVPRGVLFAIVDFAGLEGLEGHGFIAIVVVAYRIEIVAPAIEPQVLGPGIFDPLDGYVASGLEGIDLVGAAAQRYFERRLLEIASRPPVLGKHRELADDRGKLVVLAAAEGEFHDALIELLRLGDVLPVGGVLRRAFDFRMSNEKTTSSAVIGWPSC